MGPRRAVPALLVVSLLLAGGCGPHAQPEEPHHVGAKVNLADFARNPTAYRGKALMLPLRVDEPIDRARGQSLRDYVGRDVKFTTAGARGERLDLVIRLPEGLAVPEVGKGDEVFVTFACVRGSLRQGNEARTVETP
jgi:hypothetical protein